ncbi:hypothetical protein LR48_Vigan04g147900 [Vigna angularis]|uniref:Pentatricopeptide repeat-containing protein n=1 Tax=Phaseolus angularis TaxID=3914 RepID=A0A0L9UEX3_PHAAN|nr:hypothetical protein LR48_Vigan04g147900 [Vigna angularis]
MVCGKRYYNVEEHDGTNAEEARKFREVMDELTQFGLGSNLSDFVLEECHQLELLPPLLRYPIHTFPRLLIPQTTTFTMKEPKKKKRKEATTSDILHLMDALPFPRPVDIYTSLIKECTVFGDPETAIELYTYISKSGMKPLLPFLNRILIMFVSCGLFENARHMFDKMRVRDFNSWATLFVAYYDNAEN